MPDKKWKYGWYRIARAGMAMAAVFLISTVMYGTAYAANGSPVSGEPKEVLTDMQALSEMREDASVVVEFSEGDYIFVTEETEEWYTIFYQGSFLYISKNEKHDSAADNSGAGSSGRNRTESSSDSPKVGDIDTDELTKEFAEEAAANEVWSDSLETQREAAKKAGIWRTAIILVAAGIVVAVFVSSILRRRKSIEPKESEE